MVALIRSALALVLLSASVSVAAAPCAGFTDVEDTDAFCPNVTWIKNRTITLGCDVGLYCPTAAVSRLALAAFLNRLGDVVLPPNVIWVAPAGGQFQSIQAAIDYAATLPPAPRRLVKVAPGTYTEAIVMAPDVDIEGSGPGATRINGLACGVTDPPATATVTGTANAQLRDVTIVVEGSGLMQPCAAVYLDSVNGTALRNVHIHLRQVAVGPLYGVVVVSHSAPSYALTLDQVYIEGDDLGASRIGVVIDGAAFSTTLLREVTFSAIADFAQATGVRVTAGLVNLDRTRVFIHPGVGSNAIGIAVHASGTSDVSVERSSLRAATKHFADVAPSATVRIAHTMLEGALTGAATCFGTYSPTFTAAAC
jgi:hypothetical protein